MLVPTTGRLAAQPPAGPASRPATPGYSPQSSLRRSALDPALASGAYGSRRSQDMPPASGSLEDAMSVVGLSGAHASKAGTKAGANAGQALGGGHYQGHW
jgi:hypothetical protein